MFSAVVRFLEWLQRQKATFINNDTWLIKQALFWSQDGTSVQVSHYHVWGNCKSRRTFPAILSTDVTLYSISKTLYFPNDVYNDVLLTAMSLWRCWPYHVTIPVSSSHILREDQNFQAYSNLTRSQNVWQIDVLSACISDRWLDYCFVFVVLALY